MTVTAIILALLLGLVVHEAAHALALRRFGMIIEEAGLGLPIPPVFRFRVPRLPFKLAVSPWLLGAYVQPSHEDSHKLEKLPYRDQAWFLNAGIVINIVAGAVLKSLWVATQTHWFTALAWLAFAAAFWFGRRVAAAYLLPALALPCLALLLWSLAGSWAAGESGLGFASLGDGFVLTGLAWLNFAAAIQIALAVVNTLPLFGLDNGKVVSLALERWLGERGLTAYRFAGIFAVAALLTGAIISDGWAIIDALT